MHVTQTQGEAVYDISLTATEARHLQTILNWSQEIWRAREEPEGTESLSWKLFMALDKAGVKALKADPVACEPERKRKS